MLNTIRVLAFVVATTCLASTARSEGQDGSFFLHTCSAAVKKSDGSQLSEEEEAGALFCASYVGGFLDAMSLAATLSKGGKFVCVPERGITNDQAARLLVKYLRDNPEKLHQSGRMSLYIALAKTFPCPK